MSLTSVSVPILGIIFLSGNTVRCGTLMSYPVSVPILGIIFLSVFINTLVLTLVLFCFRPHIGDYFFIPTLYNYDN